VPGRAATTAALVLLVFASGCHQQRSASFASASQLPDDERRADGIAVDLTSEPPAPRDDGHSADAVLTLRTPLGERASRAVLRGFLEAVLNEDAGAVAAKLSDNAMMHDTRKTGAGGRRSATHHWHQRFRKHDYRQLSLGQIYREGDVATYRAEQVDQLPLAVRYIAPDSRPELVLRVPILTPSWQNVRLFGNELYFWLRRDGAEYVIERMAETY
jgi:hypothetical protein